MDFQNTKKYFLIISIFMIGFSTVSAANISFDSDKDVGIGQEVKINITIDTEGKAINAIDGVIDIPESLDFVVSNTGNSFVSLWIREPEYSDGKIYFSGITPGGFNKDDGKILSFVVRTKGEDQPLIYFEDIKILLHDGLGTIDSVEYPTLKLNVKQYIPVEEPISVVDNELPEKFTPIISSDPNIFDGDLFISFSSKDNASGISRYEIAETSNNIDSIGEDEWVVVKSPYRIKNQKLNKNIYIRAIDNLGNIRLVSANQGESNPINKSLIVVLTVLIVIFILKLRKKV